MRVLEELLQRILEQLKIANQLKSLELRVETSIDQDLIDKAEEAQW